jgi:hypothetical protein
MRRFVGALVFFLALHGSVASENEDSGLRGNGKAQENYMQAKERVLAAENLGEKGVEQADAGEVVSTRETLDVDEEKAEVPTETIDPKKTETNSGEATGKTKDEKVEAKPKRTASAEQSEHDQEKRLGANLENKKAPSKVKKDVVFGEKSQKIPLAEHVGGTKSDEIVDQGPLVTGTEVNEKELEASREVDKRLSDDKTTSDKNTQDKEPKVVEDDGEELDTQYGYSPSICGVSREAVEKVCNTEVNICKYETQQPSGKEPFHITTTLRPNQGDCIRRCDRRYGLSETHCLTGETCFTDVTACTKCALLTRRGCEAF